MFKTTKKNDQSIKEVDHRRPEVALKNGQKSTNC